ncbi:hypothetical protein CTI12_AA586330 [Artemisia annua]|uniref:Methyltransferase type 11 domain-containing protein n=1 Tax=Artemisia annua TaxID=35608 RepID=A0A2U1KMP0_ARTAN|nr:hypothetical protein CTI12_AA586330 [Artemisia annua]
MDFKAIKWQILRGSLTWRLVIRGMFFVFAMVVVTWTRIASEMRTTTTNDDDLNKMLLSFEKCSLNVNDNVVSGKNLSVGVVKELMNKEILRFDSRALCVGEDSDMVALTLRELGLVDAVSVYKNPILSLLRKELVGKLEFDANSFDFVFSASLERASVPALVVLEIERVLRPGGVGVMLVGSGGYNTRSLVRSATPVSLLLRSSEILHVCGISSFTLIVFKKQMESVAYFENYKLPSECPSIAKNKPFMEYIEPIVDQRSGNAHEIAYLPKFLNISARSRLIYINMGAGGFDQRYPIHPDAFNVYVVDHNVSALTSHVKKPGVTFVYHPGLVEDDTTESNLMSVDYLEAPLHEEQFEFIDWFRETAKDGDFVVLMMNAGVTQLKD